MEMILIMLLVLSSLTSPCYNTKYIEATPESIQTEFDIINTQIELQNDLNESFKIQLDNIKVMDDLTLNLNQEFGFVGTATLVDYYEYGYVNSDDMYYCVKVSPVKGSDWFIYIVKPDNISNSKLAEYQQSIINKLQTEKSLTVYVTAMIDEETYQYGQGNIAIGNIVELSEYEVN